MGRRKKVRVPRPAPIIQYVPTPTPPLPEETQPQRTQEAQQRINETQSNANAETLSTEQAETPEQLRVQNLLNRRKGRVGLINTSYRGLLRENEAVEGGGAAFGFAAPIRKKLLGE